MNTMNYAGFWGRFLAAFTDGILLSFVSFAINLLVGVGGGVIIGLIENANGMHMDMKLLPLITGLTAILLSVLSRWLYYALMESSHYQATLGKKICNLIVTDTEGEQLTFARASGRYWAKWISSLTCLIGYIMAAFTERKQALHDMIAGTLVLRNED